MLVVDKKINVDGIEYEGYEILSVEWDLQNDLFSVKVLYKDDDYKTKRVKNHYFRVPDQVDINEIIEQIHKIHDEAVFKKGI